MIVMVVYPQRSHGRVGAVARCHCPASQEGVIPLVTVLKCLSRPGNIEALTEHDDQILLKREKELP